MPQVSVTIDEKTLQKVEIAAQKQGISVSRWIVEHIKAKVDPIYPANFANLFGSISDETFTAPLELDPEIEYKKNSIK